MAITVIAKLKTKAGSEKQFEEAARKMIETVRSAEPGHASVHAASRE